MNSNPYHNRFSGFRPNSTRDRFGVASMFPHPGPSAGRRYRIRFDRNTQLLGFTANAVPVIDRPNSHRHLARPLLQEALLNLEIQPHDFAKVAIPMGRVVGECTCVETGPGDEIVYARRPNRLGLTRFVKNRMPAPCSSVLVILKPTQEFDAMVLITAFVGTAAEPEPWDRIATEQAWEYWTNHALLWGTEPIVPGTETSVCPWRSIPPGDFPPDSSSADQ